LRAALLAGSAGRGDADRWSDIDLILYVDTLPVEDRLREVARAAGIDGIEPKEGREEASVGVEGFADGVRVEIVFLLVAFIDAELERLLDRLEAVGATMQKALAGMVDGLPLRDDSTLRRWRERLAVYPEPLRRA